MSTKSKPKLTTDTAVQTAEELVLIPRQPRVLLPLGRGTRGKSWLSRLLIETAIAAGRAPLVADCDRQNMSLSRGFDGVLSPASADEHEVRSFVAAFFETIIERRCDGLLDLGAGDVQLRHASMEMELVPWLASLGIDVVLVHCLGPSLDDMEHLASAEAARLVSPMTVLVLNEAAVPPNRDPAATFTSAIGSHPILAATVARGARIVRLPRLACAPEADERGISALQAAEGRAPDGVRPLGPWATQQAVLWRRRTDEALAPVADWLL